MSKVIVILNKHAGVLFRPFRKQTPEAVRKAFCAVGLEPEIRVISPKNIVQTLHEAIDKKPEIIVVAGGDGTINTAATILGGSDIALAVLPRGTFNIFARHMGLPFSLDKIASMVAKGHSRLIEVGEVNNHVFTLFSSIGVYPQFVRERKLLQRRRGWWKPFAMLWALGKSILRFPRLSLHVTLENQKRSIDTTSIIITTTPGAMSPIMLQNDGPHFLTDKLLHLYVGRQQNRRQMLASFINILFKGPNLERDFESVPITSLSVDVEGVRRRVLAACDGELFRMQAPLHYRIKVSHLRVLLPEDIQNGR